jgi:hypothetical protein
MGLVIWFCGWSICLNAFGAPGDRTPLKNLSDCGIQLPILGYLCEKNTINFIWFDFNFMRYNN